MPVSGFPFISFSNFLYLLMFKPKTITAFFLLLGFIFFFAHCEINLLPVPSEGVHHAGHDFCDVVNKARIQHSSIIQKKIISSGSLFIPLQPVHELASPVLSGRLTGDYSIERIPPSAIHLVNRVILI